MVVTTSSPSQATAVATQSGVRATRAEQTIAAAEREVEARHRDGKAIFRFDTFGDEQLWTGVLRARGHPDAQR